MTNSGVISSPINPRNTVMLSKKSPGGIILYVVYAGVKSEFLTQYAAKAIKDEVHLLIHYIEISSNTKYGRWIPIQADKGREILLKKI